MYLVYNKIDTVVNKFRDYLKIVKFHQYNYHKSIILDH